MGINLRLPSVVVLAMATGLAGCSAKEGPSSGFAGQQNNGGNGPVDSGNSFGGFHAGGVGGAGGSGGSGAGASGAGGSSGGSVVNVDTCAAMAQRAEGIPVDMYVMFDQSVSMNELVGTNDSRWTALVRAFKQFLSKPTTAGIGVGIQYFGLGPPDQSSCNPDDYANPDVEIAPLPGNATAIKNSLSNHMPTSDTPTVPALTGAIAHARAWATAHPTHVTIAVLATDGLPFGCGTMNDVTPVVAAAADGLAGTPSIKTFVIGVPPMNSPIDNVGQIATAGGTTAIIFDNMGDVAQQFVDALDKVRGSVQLACEYTVPQPTDGQKVNPGEVNISYTPGTGPQAGLLGFIYKVDSATVCDMAVGGWYYEDAAQTKIKLCDKSCQTVSGDQFGLLQILVGCSSKPVPH